MININEWMEEFVEKLRQTFGTRIWFAGLQGSYGRGEATDKSDIDVVVILDKLSLDDIKTYKNMLDTLPYREYICGFVSGKGELFNWEPSDLFQFINDTIPIIGTLDELQNLIKAEDVDRAIRIGACNIYHALVHNMIHERDENLLKDLYKSASFVINAINYKNTGRFENSKIELLGELDHENKLILKKYIELKNGGKANFDSLCELLFCWAQNIIFVK